MRKLLKRLKQQTYVVEVAKPIERIPAMRDFAVSKVDDLTLEVTVKKNQPMNGIFAALTAKKIAIRNIREKTNRLEQLFLELTAKQVAS